MIFQFGIRQKLATIFFLFFLIFSGTVSLMVLNMQEMVETTEGIVSHHNQLDALCEVMLAALLTMEENHKKYLLLQKEQYKNYFLKAREDFENALSRTMALASRSKKTQRSWQELAYSYERHRSGLWDDPKAPGIGLKWVTEQVSNRWINGIDARKRANLQAIEQALREMNERSRVSVRNGLIGFFLSIAASILGLGFITRSILSPLKKLATALKRISLEKDHQPISLKGGEEFHQLAAVYNDMSRQLHEEENIRNEFIATLSHEIRTPLSSIRESVNMIVEEVFGPVNEKQRKFLTIAGVEIQRINKLLNYLLNVSVLEAGERKKNSTPLNTGELVRNSTETFALLAEKKKVTIIIQSQEENIQLYGVREELQQVFVNIIGNAVKYSPEQGLVTVSWIKDKARHFVRFHVIDGGTGIAEEEMPLIFSRYYRTKGVRGHLDGVGLGLAIARKIILSYGGDIHVANNDGPGCTFTFTLPVPS